jgi:hypothetical protein
MCLLGFYFLGIRFVINVAITAKFTLSKGKSYIRFIGLDATTQMCWRQEKVADFIGRNTMRFILQLNKG